MRSFSAVVRKIFVYILCINVQQYFLSFCASLVIIMDVVFLVLGIDDLLSRGGSKKILPVLPQLIIPIKCKFYIKNRQTVK